MLETLFLLSHQWGHHCCREWGPLLFTSSLYLIWNQDEKCVGMRFVSTKIKPSGPCTLWSMTDEAFLTAWSSRYTGVGVTVSCRDSGDGRVWWGFLALLPKQRQKVVSQPSGWPQAGACPTPRWLFLHQPGPGSPSSPFPKAPLGVGHQWCSSSFFSLFVSNQILHLLT